MAINNAYEVSASSDTVAIFNQETLAQAFGDAVPVKVSSNQAVQYMRNPIETGASIVDHQIILPDVVSITCVVPNFTYRNLVADVINSSRAGTQFTVQTKSRSYSNMVIEEFPIEEDPDKFNAITVTLNFSEVQFDTARIQTLPAASVTNAMDQSTVDRGEQQSTESQSSVLFSAAEAAGAIT